MGPTGHQPPPQAVSAGSGEVRRRAARGTGLLCQKFARTCATHNLTSPHPATLDSPIDPRGHVGTRDAARRCEHRRIDGKDGVAGSIPAGGSTPVLTSGNAGQFSVWGSVERAMLGRRGVRGGVVRARAGWRALPWLTVWVLDELTPRGCLPGAALCLPNGPERMIVISLAGPPPYRPYGSTRSTSKKVGPDTSRLSGFPSPAPW